MSDRRYVVAYGELLYLRVARAPDREPGNFLTKAQAAQRIVDEMDGAIALARDSRRRAMRVLRAEKKKEATSDR